MMSRLRRLLKKLGLRHPWFEADDLSRLRRNWEKLGKEDPLWAVLTHPDKKGNRWDREEFLATGRPCVDDVMKILADRNLPASKERALDFGCGVGRLTFALAGYFRGVDGVDISAAMLDQARLLNPHGERCRFHLADSPPLPFADRTFDLVFSFIVLQHMRTEYALNYIAEFVRVLRPGGVAYFQSPLRFLAEGEDFGISKIPFKDGSARIEMHAHPRAEVEAAAEKAGGLVREVLPDRSAGDAFESVCYLVVRRNAP